MSTLHVIPVPRGMSVEESYEEIATMGRFVEYRWWKLRYRWPFVRWAVIDVIEEDDDASGP